MTSLNGTSPAPVRLRHDAWGRLVYTDPHGHEHPGVEAVRAFPITAPQGGVALCAADGRELLWIERLEDLSPADRTLIEDDLARRHFLPVIERVVRVTGASEPTEWLVDTDRGRTTFTLKSGEDVRRLAGGRVLVVDAFGIRYLIPDLAALDGASRRALERYV